MFEFNDVYEWLQKARNNMGDLSKIDLALKLVREEVSELEVACLNNDEEDIKDAIIDTMWTLLNVSFFSGIRPKDLNDMVTKVSASNWSKFCNTEVEAISTCDCYKSGTHPYSNKVIDASYEIVRGLTKDYYVVKGPDGKVLKSINYRPVESL